MGMVVSVPVTYPKEVVIQYYNSIQSPLIIGLDSENFTQKTEIFLNKVKPSGIVLLKNNIKDYKQTKALIEDIHTYARNRGISIEVMVDEEGGIVSRFKDLEGYPDFKGIQDFDQNEAEKQAAFVKGIGIDTNLAPVTDISYTNSSVLYGRSAGKTPQKVTDVTSDYIKILHENSIKTTVKHFPGHGRTLADTHMQEAKVDITYNTWIKEDARPIISAITNNTEYVMFGHLTYSQIDNTPASISRFWVNILRSELGFKGGIMTDDLKMSAMKFNGILPNCKLLPDTDENTNYAILIKKALDAGVNNPMLILSQSDMGKVYSQWLAIEKICK